MMVIYPSLNFYEWIFISTSNFLFFIEHIICFVYEWISFIYIIHVIAYGFKCGPSTYEGI